MEQYSNNSDGGGVDMIKVVDLYRGWAQGL